MKLGFLMLGAACALCTAAGAVTTGNLDGMVSTGYTYTSLDSVNLNTFDIGGVAKYHFDGSGFNIQGAFNYATMNVEHVNLNNYVVGGALFYRDAVGAIGAFGEYNRYDVGGTGIDFETYGLAGEWYATPNVTARAYFAGLSADGGSGAYGGGGASYYVIPDLSLNLDGSYNNIDSLHWYSFKAGAEYLLSHEYPITLGVSYIYTKYTGLDPTSNGVMVRLTWRIGDSGSLVDLDRSGPLKTPRMDFLPI
jgi:hypothetical protein